MHHKRRRARAAAKETNRTIDWLTFTALNAVIIVNPRFSSVLFQTEAMRAWF